MGRSTRVDPPAILWAAGGRIASKRGADKGGVPVHNPGYDFNDDLLPIGASYLAGLVEQELA